MCVNECMMNVCDLRMKIFGENEFDQDEAGFSNLASVSI